MKKETRPMRPAYVVTVETPRRFLLDGLWFGPKKAKRVIVFVHGLTSSAFAMSHLIDELVDRNTAVLSFNNRGFKIVTDIKQLDKTGNTVKWRNTGGAHEVFTDCMDDIQGAVDFARKAGARDIFLMGHSTGAQKSVYWMAKRGRGVRAAILLGALSDYACALELRSKRDLAKAVARARSFVKKGKPHQLLPQSLTAPYTLDAQRFVSLYSPDSAEEIFTYAEKKKPRVLRRVRKPLLVFLAGNEEHTKRPAVEIARWFALNTAPGSRTVVVPDVRHNFKGAERQISRTIKEFIKEAVQ